MQHEAPNSDRARTSTAAKPGPAPRPQTTLCPYCGHVSANVKACERCRGVFEPLSRQASQNAMGPWFIRDESNPFLPGFSLETLRQMVRRGRITPDSIIKGPSTRQFWAYARSVPGVSHLLGACHVCRAEASAELRSCSACGASFEAPDDREHLGLTPIRLLPGQADPAQIAAAGASGLPAAKTAAATASELPMPGRAGTEIDAAALISARQRQRRAQRRRTVGLIVLVVVLVGLGAAVAAVFSRTEDNAAERRDPPAAPSTGVPPSDRSATDPDKGVQMDAGGQQPGAESAPPQAVLPQVREPAVDDLLDQLVTANVDDLSQLIDAAQIAASGHPEADSRLAGAIASAKQRLAIARTAQKF